MLRSPPRCRSPARAPRACAGIPRALPSGRSRRRSRHPPAGARRRRRGRSCGSRCTCRVSRRAGRSRRRRRTGRAGSSSISAIICIARIFGAPDTVPAGKQARSRSNGLTPSCSSPSTSDTRCVTCEKRSGSRKRSTRTVPGLQTRERSLRPRSTSITCSARSFSDASSRSASPSPGEVVPAIGFTLARRSFSLTSVSGDEPTSAMPSSSSRKR